MAAKHGGDVRGRITERAPCRGHRVIAESKTPTRFAQHPGPLCKTLV
jgi:hypothetical protein